MSKKLLHVRWRDMSALKTIDRNSEQGQNSELDLYCPGLSKLTSAGLFLYAISYRLATNVLFNCIDTQSGSIDLQKTSILHYIRDLLGIAPASSSICSSLFR